jgi:hypothetical protein
VADIISGETIYLTWAIVVTIFSIALIAILITMRKKYDEELTEVERDAKINQKRSFSLGTGTIRGELNQILGSYALLNDYKQIAFLTSVAKQFPLDLIGVKEDSIDFIEIKSLKTPLTDNDEKIKQLVKDKKIDYKIIEGNLPKSFNVQERLEG